MQKVMFVVHMLSSVDWIIVVSLVVNFISEVRKWVHQKEDSHQFQSMLKT